MTKILGIKFNNLSFKEVKLKLKDWLEQGQNRFIVTPNPEIVLEAQHNEELFYILRQAHLVVADGFGLKLAALLIGKKLHRITGADLSWELLKLAYENDYKVLIVVWSKGLSTINDIEQAVQKKFPGLQVKIVESTRDKFNLDYEQINKFAPDIMLVGLGSPWQEKFVYHKRWKIPSLKISVGIGGALDFLTNKLRRAPKVFRLLGLEWLWRLLQQRNRWQRIYRAVVIFSCKVLVWKFWEPLNYRRNVACILYKKVNDKYYFVIIERKDDPGHWQLPQGGTDGESLATAAARELTEELNLKYNQVSLKYTYKRVYKYNNSKWGNGYKRLINMAGYKGQTQGLAIFEFLGQDKDIAVNYWDHSQWKWVAADELVDFVHQVRKAGMQAFWQKFKNYLQYKHEKD